MQILEHTSTKLVIYSRPLGLWTLTLILVLFGPVALLFKIDSIIQDSQVLTSTFLTFIPWTIVAGWFFFNNIQVMTNTFSKETQILTQEKSTILGKRTQQYAFSEIEDILIIGADGEGIPINPIQILLKSGKKIPVYLDLDFFKALPKAKETEAIVRKFLELEEETES